MLGLAVPARADVTIEVYWGPRPQGAGTVMGLLRDDLVNLGAWFGPDGAARNFGYRRVVATRDPSITGDMVVAQLQLGKKQWQFAQPDAGKVLTAAKKMTEDEGPATAQISNLQKDRVNAYLALALTQKANGDEGTGIETLMELSRIYPDLTVSVPEYSEDQAALFSKAHAQLTKLGSGLLSVSAPGCDLYVDEVHRGADKLELVESPGTFRVLAQCGDQWWRFDREVAASKTSSLRIDRKLQNTLVWSDDWFGLQLAAHDPAELAHLQQVSNMFGGGGVHVVTLQEAGGRSYIVTMQYDPKTKRLGPQFVTELGTDEDRDRIAAVAAYLARGTVSRYFEPFDSKPTAEPGPPRIVEHARSHSHSSGGIAYATAFTVAGGVVGIAGAIMLPHHPPAYGSDPACCHMWGLGDAGIVALNVGASAAALGIYSYFDRRRWMRPVSGGAALALALIPQAIYFIATENKPTCGVPNGAEVCYYLEGRAIAGGPMLAVGVASGIFAGVYYALEHKRHSHSSRLPPTTAVVPTRGGALASIGWSF